MMCTVASGHCGSDIVARGHDHGHGLRHHRQEKDKKLQASFRLQTEHGEPQWQCLFLSEICSKFVPIADATLAISEERELGSS